MWKIRYVKLLCYVMREERYKFEYRREIFCVIVLKKEVGLG